MFVWYHISTPFNILIHFRVQSFNSQGPQHRHLHLLHPLTHPHPHPQPPIHPHPHNLNHPTLLLYPTPTPTPLLNHPPPYPPSLHSMELGQPTHSVQVDPSSMTTLSHFLPQQVLLPSPTTTLSKHLHHLHLQLPLIAMEVPLPQLSLLLILSLLLLEHPSLHLMPTEVP